jgi:CheY-like chemotaxis protein
MLELRFLLVERSKALQRFLRELFENFSFSPELIKTADSPEAALLIAKDLQPDFLLTQWFPENTLHGIALFQRIQTFNPDCQFALMRPDVRPEHTEIANDAGALFLLPTPCTAAELRSALGDALKLLAVKNPRVDAHVHANTLAAERHLATLKAAAYLPTFKPGDKVVYKGRTDTVKHVILRRGEMVVQLTNDDTLASAIHLEKLP